MLSVYLPSFVAAKIGYAIASPNSKQLLPACPPFDIAKVGYTITVPSPSSYYRPALLSSLPKLVTP